MKYQRLDQIANRFTEWQEFTPTLTNISTYNNDPTNSKWWYRRVWDSLQVNGAMDIHEVTGTIYIVLPSVWTFDYSKMPNTTDYPLIGAATAYNYSAGQHHFGDVKCYDGAARTIMFSNYNGGNWDAAAPFDWQDQDQLKVFLWGVPLEEFAE